MCGREPENPETPDHHPVCHYQPRDPQWERYGIYISAFTALILLGTLFGVFWYACEADRQNGLLAASLEANSRPIVSITLLPESFSVGTFSIPVGGYIPSMEYVLLNSGKLPADVLLEAVSVYNTPNEATNVGQLGGQLRRFIFPNALDREDFTASGIRPLSVGDIAELQAGNGYIQVAVNVDYGPRFKWHTRICQSFRVMKAARLADHPNRCTDQQSNDAN